MKIADFRAALVKILPGYAWTVHKPISSTCLKATGTQSSGFNRTSTMSVQWTERDNKPAYEVKTAGFGLNAAYLHINTDKTLASALRGLQEHYESIASEHRSHAEAIQGARVQKCEPNPHLVRWSDTNNPSVSAIFLWQGLSEKGRDEMAVGLGGEIAVADWLMSYAAICERAYLRLGDELPGVFHYEIVESMGKWLGEQEAQPSHLTFEDELKARVDLWLMETKPAVAA